MPSWISWHCGGVVFYLILLVVVVLYFYLHRPVSVWDMAAESQTCLESVRIQGKHADMDVSQGV